MRRETDMAEARNKRVEVRPERCVGCRSCELACAVAHSKTKELLAAIHEDPPPKTRVQVEAAGEYCVPLACRHCEEAPCVAVCPTHAMKRDEPLSPVAVHDELCIGCRACAYVCPFGVISLGGTGHPILKCDLCGERQGAGLEPACVNACPTGALRFVAMDQMTAERRKAAAADLVAGLQAAGKAKGK